VNEAGGIKKLLFNYAMARKLFFLRQGYDQSKAAPFFDRLVFKKVSHLPASRSAIGTPHAGCGWQVSGTV
jgi:hypothetical protein